MTKQEHANNEQSTKPRQTSQIEPNTHAFEDEAIISRYVSPSMLAGSGDSSAAADGGVLQRLRPSQQQSVVKNLSQRMGNRSLQRLVREQNENGAESGEVGSTRIHRESAGENRLARVSVSTVGSRKPVIQRSIQERVSGQWDAAASILTQKYSGAGGVIDRQKDAVRNFADFIQEEDDPSVGEAMLLGAVNLALGAALGGVGIALKAVAGRLLQPALLAATRTTMGTAVDSADVRSSMRVSADALVGALVDAGKGRVESAVTTAWNGGGKTQRSSALKFKETQLQALSMIGQTQVEAMISQLAALRATEGEEDEWAAADALYEAMNESLEAAYDYQFNKMTDAWFTMQVQSVGPGVRPGVLRLYLDSRYPHEGTFRITGGDLTGEGSNEEIRSRITSRPLDEIGIPKVIRMNGSMGWGIADCDWWIEVTGQEAPSSEPAFRAPSGSALEAFTSGPQRVQSYGGNRWGFPWLAAYHLGLDDLDGDDERNTSANQSEGARAVWNEIKAMTPGEIGASTWS